MSLRIIDTDESNVEQGVEILALAFQNSVVARSLLPNGWTPAVKQYYVDEDLKTLRKPKRGYHAFYVIDEDTGEIVSLAHWRLEDKETINEPDEREPPPEGYRKEVASDFHGMIAAKRKKILGEKTYWHLKVLATKPNAQRRGAGRLALQWGLRQADEAGLECYLDASKMGKPLYERWGFEVVEATPWDGSKYGVHDPYTSYHMVRKPRTV